RLVSLARLLIPYRSEDAVAQGVALTRAVLHAAADLAHARGAIFILVVPQIGVEDPTEARLRQRVLDDGGIRYVPVPIAAGGTGDGSDRHPDARGARAIAQAIAATCASSSGCR